MKHGSGALFRATNLTKGAVLMENGRVANTLWQRLVGLLRDPSLAPGDGLWITPCNSIHSIGMKFHFDAVFLDADLAVVHCEENMAPGRLSRIVWRAKSVLELPAGTVCASGTAKGDQLELQGIN